MRYISNKEFYEKSFKSYGISAQGVHWRDKFTQYKRFEIITEFIKKDIKVSTIADAGCGLGEYYNYLKLFELIPLGYKGIDCEDIMLNVCKKRFPDVSFELKNILYEDFEQSDYVVCSGAMNIMNFDQCSLFIKRCYKNAKKGFVFNFLQSLTLNGIKPYEILALCGSLCEDIDFKEGYLKNDFTVFMRKY